jgi:hypothetical protein
MKAIIQTAAAEKNEGGGASATDRVSGVVTLIEIYRAKTQRSMFSDDYGVFTIP